MKNRQSNPIRMIPAGYGHYRISCMFYGKEISCVTNNMPAIDDYRSEFGERDGHELREKRGYEALYGEIVRKYRNSIKKPRPAYSLSPGEAVTVKS